MNKALCTLLFLAILGIAQCESFMRIPIDQGRISINRNLETTTLKKAAVEGSELVSTTPVKIVEEFLKNNSVEATAKPNMIISLSSSETIFCDRCQELVVMKCEGECKTGSKRIYFSNAKVYESAYQIENEVATPFVSITDGETNVWALKNKPLHLQTTFNTQGGSNRLPDKSAYGILGLGTQDNAAANFVTETPIFSVKLNSTLKGNLIFGNDTTQFDASKKSLTWKTSANWVSDVTSGLLYSKELNINTNKTFTAKLYFDLNQNFTSLQYDIFYAARSAFNLTTEVWTPYYVYNSTKTGIPISKLPPLILGTAEENITIPLEALFKKVEDRPGCFVFVAVADSSTRYNNNATTSTSTPYGMIFGSYFMSNFYTVFQAPKGEGKTPFVSLHPTYTPLSDSVSSGGSGGKFLIGLIAVIGLGAVGFIVFRNKAASKLAEHLNEK